MPMHTRVQCTINNFSTDDHSEHYPVFIKNWTLVSFVKTIIQLFFFSNVTNIKKSQVAMDGQFRTKCCLACTGRTLTKHITCKALGHT